MTPIEQRLRSANALQLAQDMCAKHGVSFDDAFVQKSRRASETRARHEFALRLFESGAKNKSEIARILGCDHTSVISAISVIKVRQERKRVVV